MRGRRLPRRLERLLGRRDDEQSIERELIEGILRHQEVAGVRRIEAAAKDTDAHQGQTARVIRDAPDRGARRQLATRRPGGAS